MTHSASAPTTSVWYSFTPAVSSPLTADTFGSDYDTLLSAYTGTQGALTQLACNDDAGSGVQSRVRFPVTAGTTYYFMVAGVGGGNLVFTLDAAPLPLDAAEGDAGSGGGPSRRTPPSHLVAVPAAGLAFVSLYMQAPGGPRVRVNRSNTHGWSGGFDGDTFVYQEVTRTAVEPPVLRCPDRRPLGAPTWRKHAGLGVAADAVRGSAALRPLARQPEDRPGAPPQPRRPAARWSSTGSAGATGSIWPGQVNGNYAVWARCTISNPTLQRLHARHRGRGHDRRSATPGRQQYSPSVTSDGTLYFVTERPRLRSTRCSSCGGRSAVQARSSPRSRSGRDVSTIVRA